MFMQSWKLPMESWISNMKHFFIIANVQKDENLTLTKKMKSFIEEKNGTCSYYASQGKRGKDAVPELDKIPKETECIFVLGGDGTLIRAATGLVSCNLPFIGVNLGTLGYLCELAETDVFEAIEQLMQDTYVLEERMLLTGHGVMHGENTKERIAFNEITIHRTGALSIISMIVSINGEYLHTFHGDGIIVSTPTGSTGYSMSAGGPIVDPKAKMMLLTPVNAHNLNSRSIVIGADDEVVLEFGSRRIEKDEFAEVSFDGDGIARLGVGDRFVIKRADSTIKICRLKKESFLEILRKKMQVYS